MFYLASVCPLATSGKNYLSDLRQNFTKVLALDKEVPLNFGGHLKLIHLGGGLRSPTVLVDLYPVFSISRPSSCICYVGADARMLPRML